MPGGNGSAYATPGPILLSQGAVVESATDMLVQGAPLPFTHTRTYSSLHRPSDPAQPLSAMQGRRWEAGLITMFLYPSGNNVLLYLDPTSKRTFTGSGGTYTAPADFRGTLTYSSGTNEFVLTMPDQGLVYTFYDFTVSSEKRGTLKRIDTLYTVGGTNYLSFSMTNGRINVVTTSQSWQVSYSFFSDGRIQTIQLKKGPTEPVMKDVTYTYYNGTQDADVGTDGDLIMVVVKEADSAGYLTIQHVTQYRYYSSAVTDGTPVGRQHHLKMVLEPRDIERIITSGNADVDAPAKILGHADSYTVAGGHAISEYASRSFTYYTKNLKTDNSGAGTPADPKCLTPWSPSTGENLESTYGGSNVAEEVAADTYADSSVRYYDMVKSETIRAGCGSCGSGGGGVKKTYFYMDISGTVTPDKVTRIVVEDTEDSANPAVAVSRTVYGFNSQGTELRRALIENPLASAGSIRAWCQSTIVGTSGQEVNQTLEYRLPSAHTGVNSNALLTKFLNPTSGTNDSDTLNASTGLIYVYGYNANGYRTDEKAKQGRTGTAYYIGAMDYNTTATFLQEATYIYPMQTTTRNDGYKTSYSYTFHDTGNTKVKTITTTYPVVDSSQNGSGVAITNQQYFDELGRLRWIKDGEGYVHYRAYDPQTGSLSFEVTDVDTSTLPTELVNGDNTGSGSTDDLWDSWSGAAGITRDSGLPTALNLMSKTLHDDLDRPVEIINPGGSITYVRYNDNETRVYPAFVTDRDPNTAGNQTGPLLPVRVTKTNDADQTAEEITVDPSGITFSDPPTGTETFSQSAYASWTKYSHDAMDQLQSIDRYHDIPSSGNGTLSTNFYRTFYRYDAQGRQSHTIEVISGTSTTSSVEQVTKKIYDFQGRVIELHRGVSSASHDMGSSYGTDPTTLAKVEATFFDEATAGSGTSGVGDRLVTTSRSYWGTGTNDFSKTSIYYNWRNHKRGIAPDAAPFMVEDTDLIGRVLATASFDAAPNWSTVIASADYAENASDSNRRSLSASNYDKLGRQYQSSLYAVSSAGAKGNKLVTNRFYNRNSQIVGKITDGFMGTELAYDGAERYYESRRVTSLAGTKYTSGVYNYRSPAPKSSLAGITGGDDKVLELQHAVFNGSGSIEQKVKLVSNHTDTNGLNIDESTKDYVQTVDYSWYDAADRLTATATYGSGDTAGGAGQWKYFALPTRPSTPPSSSDSVLVMSYSYDSQGRLERITDPKGMVTKTVYDKLSRTKYSIENYDNFNESTEADAGDAMDHSKDRVTKFAYNGLSQITQRTGLDSNGDGSTTSGDDQTTTYLYEDTRDASLTTNIIYPDSSDTNSSGTDQVKITYNLDGTPATRTDQRGAVLTFDYDALRRQSLQRLTTTGGVDTSVQSIKREYDGAGRLEKVTSYASNDGTGTAANQVLYEYNDLQAIAKEYQEHAGAKGASTLYVQHDYDTSNDSGAFTKAFRPISLNYPNARVINYLYADASDTSGIGDAISRLTAIASNTTRGTSDANVIASYQYNGVGTMVIKDYPTRSIQLDYYGGTSGTYAGFDRFGRIIQQRWGNSAGTSNLFNIKHGYDRDSNRLYADDQIYKSSSQVYAYDGLNRLTDQQAGLINSTKDGIQSHWKTSAQNWNLDALGNHKDVDSKYTTDTSKNVHNKANEILDSSNPANVSRSVKGNPQRSRFTDTFGANTSANWEKIGSGDAFDINSTNPGYLTVTTVAQDSGESISQSILLWGEAIGTSGIATTTVTFPSGTTSGQAGIVFGYKGAGLNYWKIVADIGAQKIRVYNGGTLHHEWAKTITAGTPVDVPLIGARRSLDNRGPTLSIFPAGRYGLYTTVANTKFDSITVANDAERVDVAGRWLANSAIPFSGGGLLLTADDETSKKPIFLKGVRAKRFEITFSVTRQTGGAGGLQLVFDGKDQDDYDSVIVFHTDTRDVPIGKVRADGKVMTTASGSGLQQFMPATIDSTTTLWFQVFSYNALNVNVKCATSEAGLGSASICYQSSSPDFSGGMIGFAAWTGSLKVDNLTVKIDDDGDSSMSTEHYDSFTLDATNSTYAEDTLTYDAAGNLTYDGVFRYSYDAWNRQVKVTKGYRNSSGTLTSGSDISISTYDGLGRRIEKQVTNSADWDATYHYYYDGQQMIEVRNGSDQVLKQQVWGKQYVDELIQVGINQDPQHKDQGDYRENDCERFFWVCQDANYNVLGVFNGQGLAERYEYTPYGQRQVFGPGWRISDVDDTGTIDPDDFFQIDAGVGAPGTRLSRGDLNGDGVIDQSDEDIIDAEYLDGRDTIYFDPLALLPMMHSVNSRYLGTDMIPGPLCEFGHQGLIHDDESGLVYNRLRMLQPQTGRFLQRDALDYIDGPGLYEYVRSLPVGLVDPGGLQALPLPIPVEPIYPIIPPGFGLPPLISTTPAPIFPLPPIGITLPGPGGSGSPFPPGSPTQPFPPSESAGSNLRVPPYEEPADCPKKNPCGGLVRRYKDAQEALAGTKPFAAGSCAEAMQNYQKAYEIWFFRRMSDQCLQHHGLSDGRHGKATIEAAIRRSKYYRAMREICNPEIEKRIKDRQKYWEEWCRMHPERCA